MTDKELLEKAIYWFRVIAEDMERITSGNLPHNAVITKGRAIRAYEFLEKHKNEEPVNKDLEKELKYYCNDYYNCDYPKQIEDENCSEVMPHIVSAAKHFAQWQKEQMMLSAVQGFVNTEYQDVVSVKSRAIEGEERKKLGLHLCAKVKLIIVKED